jgi:23S rRNA (uridine2552-2'-O)-methyltransferase
VSGKIESNKKVKKNKTTKAWITEHVNDAYVQRARVEGWRSRAAYKLFRQGMTVVDLGSAPGSWSQVAAKRVAPGGRLIALDLLPMEPVHGVEFIQGDFHDDAVLKALSDALAGRQVDLVLSDMAPNMSGIGMVDQARVMVLAELTLEFCALHLKPGGDMLVKVFQGDGFMELRRALQDQFQTLQMRKPAASRNRSAEIYLLARNKKA